MSKWNGKLYSKSGANASTMRFHYQRAIAGKGGKLMNAKSIGQLRNILSKRHGMNLKTNRFNSKNAIIGTSGRHGQRRDSRGRFA